MDFIKYKKGDKLSDILIKIKNSTYSCDEFFYSYGNNFRYFMPSKVVSRSFMDLDRTIHFELDIDMNDFMIRSIDERICLLCIVYRDRLTVFEGKTFRKIKESCVKSTANGFDFIVDLKTNLKIQADG